MKTNDVAFVVVAVFFRTASLVVALFGLFMTLMPLVAFVSSLSTGASSVLVRIVATYFVAAIGLWFAAKPAASLVTRGLDVESPKA
jgi:hypothetical protein